MTNRFGFDPDNIEIYCMSLVGDAEYAKAQAEEEARLTAEKNAAVRAVSDSIDRFFKYFEGSKLLEYVAPYEAVAQIMASLNDVGHVPMAIINEAAADMLVLNASVTREVILKELINMTGKNYDL